MMHAALIANMMQIRVSYTFKEYWYQKLSILVQLFYIVPRIGLILIKKTFDTQTNLKEMVPCTNYESCTMMM